MGTVLVAAVFLLQPRARAALVEQGGKKPLKPGAGFPGAGRCSTSVQPIFRNDSLARWAMKQMCLRSRLAESRSIWTRVQDLQVRYGTIF